MLNTISHYMANCSGALLRDVVVYTASLCITQVSKSGRHHDRCVTIINVLYIKCSTVADVHVVLHY
jgi:hypothetical protein